MRFTVFLLFFSVALVAMAVTGSRAEKILPYQIYQYKLDNDLKVVVVPFDSPGLASFYVVVSTGSRNIK